MADYEHQKRVEAEAREAVRQAPLIPRGSEGLYIQSERIRKMPNPPWPRELEAKV